MTEPLSTEEKLFQIMAKREARESAEAERLAAERADIEAAHQRRVDARKAGDKFIWDELFKTQSRCDHRKGTSGPGPKTKEVDYMVSRHVFANGVTQIKCLKCKHKAFPGDSKQLCHGSMEAYFANTKAKQGPKLQNPTKLSYNDWHIMTLEENTTNKPSRAEMLTQGPQPVTH